MICEFCGGKTVKRKVRKVHWLQQQLYIVDDVEAEVCQDCGERYYHATTLDAIDRCCRQVTWQLSSNSRSEWWACQHDLWQHR